jgi:hypothetical protein
MTIEKKRKGIKTIQCAIFYSKMSVFGLICVSIKIKKNLTILKTYPLITSVKCIKKNFCQIYI